ncbi:MAG TPA: outer membrane protein assembly factor BamB [Gallionellaceae bacterium]|nr:outer membrane protein assembly factor BamB [Gallionellaceae bacterium]
MILRHGVWLLLLPLLAGCSSGSTPAGQEPAELASYRSTAKIAVRWQYDYLNEGGRGGLQPAVTQDGVFVASARGELMRLDRANGNRLWQINSGFNISGAVGAGDGLVLVGGEKGDLAAYEIDGRLRWKTRVSSEVLSAPQVANGMVIVRTGDGRIAALSAQDGKRQWLYERPTPALVVRSHSGVRIQRGIVYAGFAAGKLAALNINNGAVIWESAVSQPRGTTELERISDITSLPEVDDEQVCAVAFQGRLSCFDIAQGATLWSRDVSSDKGMTLLRKFIYVTDANGAVLALDKSSGSSLWKNDQLYMRGVTAPAVLGDYVLVGDYKGYVHAMNREDGRLVARTRTENSPILFAPALLDDGVMVQTRGGGVYSLAIH